MKKLKPCMAYILHEERPLGCPSRDYFKLLDDGYTDWGFPKDVLYRGLCASIGRVATMQFLENSK